MPISCPDGKKARFRVKREKGPDVRLAFCGNKVVEAEKLTKKHKAKK